MFLIFMVNSLVGLLVPRESLSAVHSVVAKQRKGYARLKSLNRLLANAFGVEPLNRSIVKAQPRRRGFHGSEEMESCPARHA